MLMFLIFSLAFSQAARAALVPALFVFGDSLVDVGNNNRLITPIRANFPPYGNKFPHSEATGRFSDGRLIHDFLASYLGLPSPPAYLSNVNASFVHGANFGSAGSGIFAWPGNGIVWSLQDQVDHFNVVHKGLINQRGNVSTALLMNKSLFIICTGNEDVKHMVNMRGPLFSALVAQLLGEMGLQIQRLYALGARKFVVVGTNALGCTPSRQTFGLCNMQAMYAPSSFNIGLVRVLVRLQFSLTGSDIVAANLGNVVFDVKTNPGPYGFTNTAQGCCPLYEPSRQCYVDAEFCQAPSEFMFWDLENPTEALNQVIARQWWSGSVRYVAPINISRLVGTVNIPDIPEDYSPAPAPVPTNNRPLPNSYPPEATVYSSAPAPAPMSNHELPPDSEHRRSPSPSPAVSVSPGPAAHSSAHSERKGSHDAPSPQFEQAPSPHVKDTPAHASSPHFKHTPAHGPSPHFKHTPAHTPSAPPHFKHEAPSPHFKHEAPAPHFKHAPAHGPSPHFKHAPAHGPSPHFKHAPAHGPSPHFKHTPAHAPSPHFTHTPAHTPSPHFKHTPAPSPHSRKIHSPAPAPSPRFKHRSPSAPSPHFKKERESAPAHSKHSSSHSPARSFVAVPSPQEHDGPASAPRLSPGGGDLNNASAAPSPHNKKDVFFAPVASQAPVMDSTTQAPVAQINYTPTPTTLPPTPVNPPLQAEAPEVPPAPSPHFKTKHHSKEKPSHSPAAVPSPDKHDGSASAHPERGCVCTTYGHSAAPSPHNSEGVFFVPGASPSSYNTQSPDVDSAYDDDDGDDEAPVAAPAPALEFSPDPAPEVPAATVEPAFHASSGVEAPGSEAVVYYSSGPEAHGFAAPSPDLTADAFVPTYVRSGSGPRDVYTPSGSDLSTSGLEVPSEVSNFDDPDEGISWILPAKVSTPIQERPPFSKRIPPLEIDSYPT